MPNTQFHTAISTPRYQRYLSVCGSKNRALKLYRANIALSQQLYGVIGIFEVILRNTIDRHMTTKKGALWLEEAVALGGCFDINPGCEDAFHVIQDAIQSLGKDYTHDKLIAKLSFGFWRYQFGPKEFAASGSSLLEIFPNRPFGTRQKTIFQFLTKINDIRNRIAHHEPLCFDGTIISTIRAYKRYTLILELLKWLGCDPKRILYGIDKVEKSLNAIQNIQEEILSVRLAA